MRHSILAALIALSLALSGCSKSKGNARPDRLASTERQISKDQLFEESKRIAAGEKVGADLAKPVIVVSPADIKINGTVISDAVLPSGAPDKIQALFTWLKEDREHYKMLYPNVAFPGLAAVQIDPGSSAVAAVSVVHTIAAAGFAQLVTTGTVRLELPTASALPDERSLWLQTSASGEASLRFEGGCELPGEAGTHRQKADVNKTVEAVCSNAKSPCLSELIVFPSANDKWGDTAEWIAHVLSAPSLRKSPPAVTAASAKGVRIASPMRSAKGNLFGQDSGEQLVACKPGSVAPPKPACDTSKLKPATRLGLITATGGFTDAELRALLDKQTDAVLGCYAASLCEVPQLTGRLALELLILPGGQTMRVRTASSDLPAPSVLRCVETVFHRMTFPPRDKATEAKIPMLLSPG